MSRTHPPVPLLRPFVSVLHPHRTRRVAVGVIRAAALVVLAVATGACNNKRVARIEPTSVTDLSGRWNDADSRLVANELIEQSLTAPWAKRFADTHGGEAPTVIVGGFGNRTMEHIPVNTFVKDLERAFVNSGAVRVVASADERQVVRAEREDQQAHATTDSRARLAREQGAAYMLQGEVQAIEDAEGREKVVYYQVDAALVDLESNAKVWVGQHKIKKYIDRRRIGW
jgi:penicillin-binding protein activator